jgi:hypothetical protein
MYVRERRIGQEDRRRGGEEERGQFDEVQSSATTSVLAGFFNGGVLGSVFEVCSYVKLNRGLDMSNTSRRYTHGRGQRRRDDVESTTTFIDVLRHVMSELMANTFTHDRIRVVWTVCA